MRCRRFVFFLTPVLALSLIVLAGCGGSSKSKHRVDEDEGEKTSEKESGGGESTITLSDFTGTIEGRVEFTGSPDQGKPAVKEPDKNKGECPGAVPQSGWYTQDSSDKKGVRYAVVFVRPAGGAGKVPKIEDKVLALRGGVDGKPGPDFVEVHQPHCQFEPRVSVVLPGQKLRGRNDSNPAISHDFSLTDGKNSLTATVPPGQEKIHNPDPNDKRPYQVVCNQHTNFMNGYVWRFSHPFGAVTDADGRFVIRNVPATSQGLEVVVWHEKLETRDNLKVVGPLVMGANKKMEAKIAIP